MVWLHYWCPYFVFVIFLVQTPLHLACLSGDLTTVEHIVDMVGTEYLLQLHGPQIKPVRVVLRHPFFLLALAIKDLLKRLLGVLASLHKPPRGKSCAQITKIYGIWFGGRTIYISISKSAKQTDKSRKVALHQITAHITSEASQM